jgi:hypothetical protein
LECLQQRRHLKTDSVDLPGDALVTLQLLLSLVNPNSVKHAIRRCHVSQFSMQSE